MRPLSEVIDSYKRFWRLHLQFFAYYAFRLAFMEYYRINMALGTMDYDAMDVYEKSIYYDFYEIIFKAFLFGTKPMFLKKLTEDQLDFVEFYAKDLLDRDDYILDVDVDTPVAMTDDVNDVLNAYDNILDEQEAFIINNNIVE